jgi:hypothetical protein
MDHSYFVELRRRVSDELIELITQQASKPDSALYQIQPPESVCILVSYAATAVLMAFEHGYQIEESQQGTNSPTDATTTIAPPQGC